MAQLREIRVQTDSNTSLIRTESFSGREYLVVPVVALKEGVLFGANASSPEFCPSSALESLPAKWNGRPIVMNHPQIQGAFVSANHPKVMEDWAFGYVFNAYYDDSSLKLEAWIDTARAQELGGEFQDVVDRINSGKVVEVSTGLFCDVIPEAGTFRGQKYTAKWANINSDHLAMLSDGVLGACSIENGCGAPRLNAASEVTMSTNAQCTCQTENANATQATGVVLTASAVEVPQLLPATVVEKVLQSAMANFKSNAVASTILASDARNILGQAVKVKFSDLQYVYLVDATSDTAVVQGYNQDWESSLFSVTYTMDETGDVEFTGEPEPVMLLTSILPAPKVSEEGGVNNGVEPTEDTTVIANEGVPMTTNNTDPAQSAAAAVSAPAVEAPVVNASSAPPSMEDYLATVPPALRKMIEDGLKANASRKAALIASIKANKSNTFSDAALDSMDNEVLEGIAALAKTAEPTIAVNEGQAFLGRPAPVAPQVFAASTDDSAVGGADEQRNQAATKFGAPPVTRALTGDTKAAHRVGTWKH